jgi:hypothetical protein
LGTRGGPPFQEERKVDDVLRDGVTRQVSISVWELGRSKPTRKSTTNTTVGYVGAYAYAAVDDLCYDVNNVRPLGTA